MSAPTAKSVATISRAKSLAESLLRELSGLGTYLNGENRLAWVDSDTAQLQAGLQDLATRVRNQLDVMHIEDAGLYERRKQEKARKR